MQDPRRLDPRRVAVSAGLASAPTVEDTNAMLSEFDDPISLAKPNSVENPPAPLISNMNSDEIFESPLVSGTGQLTAEEDLEGPEEIAPLQQLNDSLDSPIRTPDEDSVAVNLSDVPVKEEADTSSSLEFDYYSPVLSNASASEDTCQDLPQLPIYVELTQEQQQGVRKLAIERIIESYKYLFVTDYNQMRLELLARLVAQVIILQL